MRQGQRILPEYSSVEHQRWWLAAKVFAVASLVFFSIFIGLLTAAGGVKAIGFMAVPLAALFGLVLWLLPDVDRVSNPPIYKLSIAYLVTTVAWPNYIALALPGLPWITPSRLVLGALLVIMVLHFAQHADSRRTVANIIGYDKIALGLYALYLATVVWTLPLAEHPVETVRYAVLQEVLYLTPMIAVAWALADMRRLKPMMVALSLTCIFTMLVSVLENWMQQPPWLNIIPSFLRVDPMLLETYLGSQARVGDGRYRIRSTFGIVIFYSQYLCLVVPLLFEEIRRMRGTKIVVGVLLVALVLQTVWFSNSRTSTLALLIPFFGGAALYGLRLIAYRRGGDPFKSLVVLVFVIGAVVALVGAIASSHRLQMYTIGGKQHAGSDEVREEQWSNARSQIVKNPVGAGAGNSGPLVGKLSPQGVYIIDSLYINYLVDFGPLGFLGFFGCLARLSWLGIMTYLRAEDETDELAGPLALGLISFIIAAYVISNTDNNFIAMAFGAFILALYRRQEMRRATVIARGGPVSTSSAVVLAART